MARLVNQRLHVREPDLALEGEALVEDPDAGVDIYVTLGTGAAQYTRCMSVEELDRLIKALTKLRVHGNKLERSLRHRRDTEERGRGNA